MKDRKRWRRIRRCPVQPCHKLSTDGDVRNRDGEPMALFPDEDGYMLVRLHGVNVRVAPLVLETFVSPPPFGRECLHDPKQSEGRQDCRLAVLRWGTHRENEGDKKRERKEKRVVRTRPESPRTIAETVP